jgi:hypothetical protein
MKYQVPSFELENFVPERVSHNAMLSWLAIDIRHTSDNFRPLLFTKLLELELYKESLDALGDHIHTAARYKLYSHFKTLIEYSVATYGPLEAYRYWPTVLSIGEEELALWILSTYAFPVELLSRDLASIALFAAPSKLTLMVTEAILKSAMPVDMKRAELMSALSVALEHHATSDMINVLLFGPSNTLLSDILTMEWLRSAVLHQNQLLRKGPLFSLLYKSQTLLSPTEVSSIITDATKENLHIVQALKDEKHLWSSLSQETRDRILVAVAHSENIHGKSVIMDTESLKEVSPDALKLILHKVMDKKREHYNIYLRLVDEVLPRSRYGQSLLEGLKKIAADPSSISALLLDSAIRIGHI